MLFGGTYSAAKSAGVLQANPLVDGHPRLTPVFRGSKGSCSHARAAQQGGHGCAKECQHPVTATARGVGYLCVGCPRAETAGEWLFSLWVPGMRDSWAGIASQLAEPWHGSLISRESRRQCTVQAAFVQVSCAAVQSSSCSMGTACVVPAGHGRVGNFILH